MDNFLVVQKHVHMHSTYKMTDNGATAINLYMIFQVVSCLPLGVPKCCSLTNQDQQIGFCASVSPFIKRSSKFNHVYSTVRYFMQKSLYCGALPLKFQPQASYFRAPGVGKKKYSSLHSPSLLQIFPLSVTIMAKKFLYVSGQYQVKPEVYFVNKSVTHKVICFIFQCKCYLK